MSVHLNPHKFRAMETPLSWRPRFEESPLTIYVLGDVVERMQAYVDIGDEEVGWMGTAHKVNENVILVDQVFLIEQRVSGVETTLTKEGFSQFCRTLERERPRGEYEQILNNLVFWGHSHVFMETNPSLQDEDTVERFRKNGRDWFVRAILNKRGRMEITYFDFKSGRKIIDAKWIRIDEERTDLRKQVESEFRSKVHSMAFGSSWRWQAKANSSLPFDLAATLKTIRTPPPEEVYDTEDPIEILADPVTESETAVTPGNGKPVSATPSPVPTFPDYPSTDIPPAWEPATRKWREERDKSVLDTGDGTHTSNPYPSGGSYSHPSSSESSKPVTPDWAKKKPEPAPSGMGWGEAFWHFITFRWL